MDAICKQRGSVKDGTGVSDSVVNQLLSKIDVSVESDNHMITSVYNLNFLYLIEYSGCGLLEQYFVDWYDQQKRYD